MTTPEKRLCVQRLQEQAEILLSEAEQLEREIQEVGREVERLKQDFVKITDTPSSS